MQPGTAKVSMSAQALVGLKNYSNVTVGPAIVERLVLDTPEDIARGLAECALHVQKFVHDEEMSVRRTRLGEELVTQAPIPPSAPTVSNGETGTPVEDPFVTVRKLALAEQIKKLPDKRRNEVRLRLVGWGVTNTTTPQEALAGLSVERVTELESWLTSLEGSNA